MITRAVQKMKMWISENNKNSKTDRDFCKNAERHLFLFLGRRFDRVDLVKPVSNVHPSVRAYECTSTTSFFDFNEIW